MADAPMDKRLLDALKNEVLPAHYRSDLSEKVDEDCLLFKKGPYICLVMPFGRAMPDDFGSRAAKGMIRNVMTCIPFFWEKGLFLIYYGPSAQWSKLAPRFTVDKTALRPVILQSIHFIDPNSGENVNSRTHWGPLNFGFCGKLIEDLEHLAKSLKESSSESGAIDVDAASPLSH